MLLYMRCVIKNRATLAGYLSIAYLIVFTILWLIEYVKPNRDTVGLSFFVSGLFSFVLLGSTTLGIQTMRTYRRVSQAIVDHGDYPDERLVWQHKQYCGYVGARMAVEDAKDRYSRYGLRII
jgi:hypothetical protein